MIIEKNFYSAIKKMRWNIENMVIIVIKHLEINQILALISR